MKYVKLTPDRTELASAIFANKPRVLTQYSDAEITQFDWFPVRETYPTDTNEDTESHAYSRWELVENTVNVIYENRLLPLETRIDNLKKKVNTIRDTRLDSFICIDHVCLDFTERSRSIVSRKASIVDEQLTEKFTWILYDNSTLSVTPSQIKVINELFSDMESDIILFARELKNNIEKSESPESIDITEGWPSEHVELGIFEQD